MFLGLFELALTLLQINNDLPWILPLAYAHGVKEEMKKLKTGLTTVRGWQWGA